MEKIIPQLSLFKMTVLHITTQKKPESNQMQIRSVDRSVAIRSKQVLLDFIGNGVKPNKIMDLVLSEILIRIK